MMIDYIRKMQDNKLMIVSDNQVKYQDRTFQKVFNDLLKPHLTDLSSRERVTSKIFSYASKVPLYLDCNNLFLCIRSYRMDRSLYINYHAIASYKVINSIIQISFCGRHELRINEKYAFISQMKKCNTIIEFLRDEKVFSYI